MKDFTIKKNYDGVRVDKFILKVCRNLPKSLMQKLIRKGRAKVNNRKVSGDYRLVEGDLVELYFNDEFFLRHTRAAAELVRDVRLDVVYEDESIIIVDKPTGQIVHSDDKESINTLITHIHAYTGNRECALCNRLDRNTAGLVIAAKNARALREMNEVIRKRQIVKRYKCVVVGVPKRESKEIRAYLVRDMEEKRVFVNDEAGQEIITRYHVIKSCDGLSLLEVDLVTGRTHQIRAHLAYVGLPILGDEKYGDKKANKVHGMRRQELLAHEIEFLENEYFMHLIGRKIKSEKFLPSRQNLQDIFNECSRIHIDQA